MALGRAGPVFPTLPLALASAALLALAAAGPVAGQDMVRVDTLIEACGERGPDSYLAERASRHGLAEPSVPVDPGTELAVDRALDPAHTPDQAMAALAEAWQSLGAEDPRGVRLAVLRNFAYFEALNCHALKQWTGHLRVYENLARKAGAGDPNRDYYERSLDKFRGKLQIALRSRARLAEKERRALAVVGLKAP